MSGEKARAARDLTRAAARDEGIRAGIPAEVVDKMLGRGLTVIETPRIIVAFRLVIEGEDAEWAEGGSPGDQARA